MEREQNNMDLVGRPRFIGGYQYHNIDNCKIQPEITTIKDGKFVFPTGDPDEKVGLRAIIDKEFYVNFAIDELTTKGKSLWYNGMMREITRQVYLLYDPLDEEIYTLYYPLNHISGGPTLLGRLRPYCPIRAKFMEAARELLK